MADRCHPGRFLDHDDMRIHMADVNMLLARRLLGGRSEQLDDFVLLQPACRVEAEITADGDAPPGNEPADLRPGLAR
jgi:hypothetical protein